MKSPEYADFRAFIDENLPALAGRIAVNTRPYDKRHNNFVTDLQTQIDKAALDAVDPTVIEAHTKYLSHKLRVEDSLEHNFALLLIPPLPPRQDKDAAEIPDADKAGEVQASATAVESGAEATGDKPETAPEDKKDQKAPARRPDSLIAVIAGDTPRQKEIERFRLEHYHSADAAFIHMGDTNPRRFLHAVSNCSTLPSLRMNFSQAAMNPAHLKWFTFFHELCHALRGIGAYDKPLPHETTGQRFRFIKESEEAVCDGFATVMTLKICGDAALPLLRTIADMRLSRLGSEAYRYHTGAAMRAVLGAHEGGTLATATPDMAAAYRFAQATAADHFITEAAFNEMERDFSVMCSPLMVMLGLSLRKDREALIDKVLGKNHKMADMIAESRTILERQYIAPALPAYGAALMRALKKPLHRLGLCPHPGF